MFSLIRKYHNEIANEAPTEKIDLRDCDNLCGAGGLTGKGHAFMIFNEWEAFYFHVDTRHERNEWLKSLGGAIVCAKGIPDWESLDSSDESDS